LFVKAYTANQIKHTYTKFNQSKEV